MLQYFSTIGGVKAYTLCKIGVEYDLLKMFLEHPREAVSRETLLQSIWGFQYDGDTRIVDVHVFKLKGKLKESQVSFKSVRGVGYKLVKKDDE